MKLINRLSFKREITFITLFSINFSGVFPLKQQAHITVRYVWIIVATFGTLYMSGLSIIEPFLRSYGFLVNITIVLNVLTSLVGYCTPVISLYSNAELVKLLELLDGGFYTYTDERKFQVRKFSTEDLLSKEISICTFLSVTYIGMTLTPLAVNLLLKDHENSAFDLLYVAWVPFGIKTGKQFFFSYIMQFLSTIPNYTSFIGTILFIYNVSREFRYQSDKLRFALKSICDRVNNKIILEEYETNPSDEIIRQRFVKCNEDEFLEKLKECMFHHQQLQKFLGYFSSWFNLIFSCQLTYGFLSFALIGYVMITGTGNIATDGKYVCLLGLFSGQLYYQCVVGEIIFTIVSKTFSKNELNHNFLKFYESNHSM